jgi:hypothetical protein
MEENHSQTSFEQHVRNFAEFWQNRPESPRNSEPDESEESEEKTNSSKCCGDIDQESRIK